tara:strand:- start:81 stop:284 length:204 start_codon:yes stop_codon:yes gene_type:complete
MEIQFETEDGLICDFTPDFRVQQNTSDHSSVQWRLSSTGTPINVGILYDEFQDEVTIYPTRFSGPIM